MSKLHVDRELTILATSFCSLNGKRFSISFTVLWESREIQNFTFEG